MKSINKVKVTTLTILVSIFSFTIGVDARVTHIDAEPPVSIDMPSFGGTGSYEKIVGTFEGEIDPTDPKSAVITDIDLAPVTDGKVRYRSTFFILRPADQTKGNGKLFYAFGNRGGKRMLQWFNDGTASNDPGETDHFGHGFLMREGYNIALSGYSGHFRAGPNIMSAEIPIAINANGSPVTGAALAELVAENEDDNTISLPYATSNTSSSNGALTVREHGNGVGIPVTGWRYTDEWKIEFPGPARIGWVYEFVYTAKDPLVMGLGHAITRDFLSFLKHEESDDFGNPNPLAMPDGLRAIYSWGRSNGGRNQRDFLRWGFNEDEAGRMVIDGMLPYAGGAGGHVWMNSRFSQPMASSRKHEYHYAPEHEFPQTFPVLTDPLTGQTDGILKRCLATHTCPKIFNIDGANEYWNKSSSLNHTDAKGNDLDIDTLSPNVRIYSIAAIEHNTTFDQKVPELMKECQQMTNPLYNGPIFRALLKKMDRWVIEKVEPPASVVPKKSDGTLVSPEAVIYPDIPVLNYEGWPALPKFVYTPDTMFRYAPLDFSAVPYQKLPGDEYVVQISQVDEDGNDIAGIHLPELSVPLGTHLGWSVMKQGEGFPDSCGQHGTFIPFAKTKADRVAAGDPRLSLEERYGDEQTFVAQIEAAATELVNEGFLLEEDKLRIIKRAREHGFNLWGVPLPK
ncbi:MAG: hypothetical protein ACI9XC_002116 [Gammaproteobacteria bacterium]|jgi:hypothetical protein